MKEVGPVALVLALTLALLAGLFAARPFARASLALDRAFGAPEPWTQVASLVRDPRTQELSRGEAPGLSFETLGAAWGARTGTPRVLIMGNSQTMAVSLAPGEPPPIGVEPTWTDLVTRHFAESAALPAQVYRLSAPGMSYPEALFYVEYLAQHPALRPDALVLQLNYQSFWNGGIRAGMLELLGEPTFRAALEREAASAEPYAQPFVEALRQAASAARAGAAASPGSGSAGAFLERTVRGWLDGVPGFAARHDQKGDLADLLYRARVYLLGLRPTTARSISGTRFVQARACLLRIVTFCREQHIRPVLYLAPVNPLLNLYRTDEDQARFMTLVGEIEKASGMPVLRLDAAIPAELWGRQFNGPDPLHLGRRGHEELARRLVPPIEEALRARHGVQ